MTNEERDALGERVTRALGFSVQPLILAHPDGRVRRILTAFGDPVSGWPGTLVAAGIPCAPDITAEVDGGIQETDHAV